jgi:hypothetical protein
MAKYVDIRKNEMMGSGKKQGDRRKSSIILDPHERLFLILVDK